MRDMPRLKSILRNDTGAFLCAWVPMLFAVLSVVLFIYFEINRDNYTAIEIICLSPVVFISLSACLWPFILWWWYSIYTTFKNGIVLEARNTNKIIKHAFDLGVIYTFEYQGKKIEHVASFIPNNTTKKIADIPSLDIVFNPQKNISFIKEAYI